MKLILSFVLSLTILIAPPCYTRIIKKHSMTYLIINDTTNGIKFLLVKILKGFSMLSTGQNFSINFHAQAYENQCIAVLYQKYANSMLLCVKC